MATTFKIQYAASATPIESTQLTDNSNVATSVHSSIDKSVGGGKEISCGSTSTNVAYVDYTTIVTATTTLDAALGATVTGIDFLMIKIREAGSSGTPDVTFRLGTGDTSTHVLSGVGDVMLLKPSGWDGADYEIFSSGATTVAKIDILYGIV
jgi:hypothetical protein|tara:strand:- start:3187 stop:3642 length:456 start_codon:yes stop_codon:yes gene_type:complete